MRIAQATWARQARLVELFQNPQYHTVINAERARHMLDRSIQNEPIEHTHLIRGEQQRGVAANQLSTAEHRSQDNRLARLQHLNLGIRL